MFIFLYYRLLLFIFCYLVLFTFIFSYNLQIAVNSGDIQSGFETYYLCLISPLLFNQLSCTLPDSVSNYNLELLKGFAISALGFFVFITFFSWDVIRFWYTLARRVILLVIHRELRHGNSAIKMILFASHVTNSITPDVTVDMSIDMEQPEEEETKDVSGGDEGGSSSPPEDTDEANLFGN